MFWSCRALVRDGHNGDMNDDWLEDETMSHEETLARFAALSPEPTRGPRLPADGYVVHAVPSYSQGVLLTPSPSSVGPVVQRGPQTASV